MKKIFDKWPMLIYYLFFIIALFLIALLGIYQVRKEPDLSNVKQVGGEVIDFRNSTKRSRSIKITLENNKTYLIRYAGFWAADESLVDIAPEGSYVIIKYINKVSREIVHLEVNDKVIFTIDDYKIGYNNHYNFRHMMTMMLFIIVLILFIVLTIKIQIARKTQILIKESKRELTFLNRLSLKSKVIIVLLSFVIPFYLYFSFMPFTNNITNRTLKSFIGVIGIYFIFFTIFLFIYLIIKIGPDPKLTKEEKEYFHKKDIFTKIKALIIISILSFIFLIPLNISENKLFYIISFTIIQLIDITLIIVNIVKLIKIKLSYNKYQDINYMPKNIYEQLRKDNLKNKIKANLKKYIKFHNITSRYNEQLDIISITIKNEYHKIIIEITKKDQVLKMQKNNSEEIKEINILFDELNYNNTYIELSNIINQEITN